MDALLGHDRGDQLRGRDVERRVARREAGSDLRRVALLDRDRRPRRRREVERRASARRRRTGRRGGRARTASPYVPTLFAVSPFAAIRSAPVSTQSTSPAAISDAAAASAIDGEGDAERVELPCRQARALEQRPRLADPDVLDEPSLPRRADRAERAAVAAGGEPARVAVRERRASRARAARPRARPCGGSARPRPRGSPRARSGVGSSRISSSAQARLTAVGRDAASTSCAASRSSPRSRGEREAVRRCDADRRRAADRERADRLGDLRGRARSGARPPRRAAGAGRAGRRRRPRAGRCVEARAVSITAMRVAGGRSRALPGGRPSAVLPCARRGRALRGNHRFPHDLESLVPAGQVLLLLLGQLVDRDAHRRELQARDLVVDLLRDDVDLPLERLRRSRPPTRPRAPGSRTTCPSRAPGAPRPRRG